MTGTSTTSESSTATGTASSTSTHSHRIHDHVQYADTLQHLDDNKHHKLPERHQPNGDDNCNKHPDHVKQPYTKHGDDDEHHFDNSLCAGLGVSSVCSAPARVLPLPLHITTCTRCQIRSRPPSRAPP